MARKRRGAPGVPVDDSLTDKELAMLQHLATGMRPPEVAPLLHIAKSTAYDLTLTINEKFGTKSYHASVLVARQRGIIR